MEELPGTTLESRSIHSGRVFEIVRDRVRLPNGRETTMEVVRHQPSVILIPMLDADHVVLVRQYRYSIDRWIWELPAGTLDPGETVEAAAIRECQEETGYVPARVEPIGAFYPTPGYCDELMHFFRLTGLTTPPAPAQQDDDEVLEPKVLTVDVARQLIRQGDVIDMKTVFGLSLVDG
jgi:ADP-ribose pyrophosphatase